MCGRGRPAVVASEVEVRREDKVRGKPWKQKRRRGGGWVDTRGNLGGMGSSRAQEAARDIELLEVPRSATICTASSWISSFDITALPTPSQPSIPPNVPGCLKQTFTTQTDIMS